MTLNHVPTLMTQSSPSPEDIDDIDWFGLLQVVADNLRLLVLAPLAAGLVALGYTYTQPYSYSATTKFLPPQQQQSAAASMVQSLGNLGGLGGLIGGSGGIRNPADQYVTFLKSNRVQDALIERFQLTARYKSPDRDETRLKLARSVQIVSEKDGLMTITVTGGDPQFAATLANAHVEELGRLMASLAVTEAQQRRVFFEKQLTSAKGNFARAEQALKSSGVGSAILKINPGSAIAPMATLKGTIDAQELKLALMRSYLAESAPEFKQAQTEIAILRRQLARIEKEDTGNANADTDYLVKYKDYKYYETLIELFTKQYEIAKVDESREGAVIQVIDPAEPPTKRASAKRAQSAISASLGVGLILLLMIFIRHGIHSAAQNPAKARQMQKLRVAINRALGRAAD
jgi:uncharacterized protein involved in exopolysaccharide biosynthesis